MDASIARVSYIRRSRTASYILGNRFVLRIDVGRLLIGRLQSRPILLYLYRQIYIRIRFVCDFQSVPSVFSIPVSRMHSNLVDDTCTGILHTACHTRTAFTFSSTPMYTTLAGTYRCADVVVAATQFDL